MVSRQILLCTILLSQCFIVLIEGHMVKSNEIHHNHEHQQTGGGQVFVENIPISESGRSNEEIITAVGSELHRSLAFYPPNLDFGTWSVGTAQSHIVTLVNKNANRSVYLSSISGKTPAFYSSFFENKVLPPKGNTTFNVVFLPRKYGEVETNLMIHTSFGQAKLAVKGEGAECPYRLKPLIGIKAPFNSTLRPEIHMYNPHLRPIQILEVYSSGGQFQLELPSGEQEGHQALWEIPPHSTKPVIRIRFQGTSPGNHSAYIRIKITGFDEDPTKENVLVIPVDFEILSYHGLYSIDPIIDFGRLTTTDETKLIKLNLSKSGNEDIEILSMDLDDDTKNTIIFNQNDHTLSINPKLAQDNIIVNGEITIKSYAKNYPEQITELKLVVRAEIFKGSLEYFKNVTIFITHARNYTKGEREFWIKNKYKMPVAITNLTIDNNDATVFKIHNFNPTIIGPGEQVSLFKIFEINDLANFQTTIHLITNLTNYKIPLIVCTGLLTRYTSTDPVNLSKQVDETTLDFKAIPFGEFSPNGFIVVRNLNPIPIQLLKWNFTNPKGVYYLSMFLGCLKADQFPNFSGIHHKTDTELVHSKFDLCLNLSSTDVAIFELALQSFTIKDTVGTFKIWTELEEIVTNVNFVTVMGRLQINQNKLHFGGCFPGTRCSADISIHSSFLKTMRVNAITVSVPGLVFEYHTKDGLPTISANSITEVGRIYFDPQSVCQQNCYIPATKDIEVTVTKNNANRQYDEFELRRRLELFRRFKWTLQTITFTLSTSEIRLFEFNSTVDIVWPKLVEGMKTIPTIEIGQKYTTEIVVTNPSDHPLQVDLSLIDPEKSKTTSLSLPVEVVERCTNCYLTDKDVFSLDISHQSHLIPPKGQLSVNVKFFASELGIHSTLLHIRNNLTVYEAVWITGKAVQPQFRFGNRKPGSTTPLLFEINEKHLGGCIANRDPNKGFSIISTKRTFTARNSGEVPILIETFQIGDKECEGYGFKILDCKSFELKANSCKKIDIGFTPDFTMARISRPLLLKTNLSYLVNYTLVGTVPAFTLDKCSKTLKRPLWELYIKNISIGVLSIAFIFVLIAAFIDSDRILKMHVLNMSKDKGPIQPTLDLRSIGVRNITSDDTTSIGGNKNSDKTNVKNVNSDFKTNIKKRNVKRNFNSSAITNTQGSGRDKLLESSQDNQKNCSKTKEINLSLNQMVCPGDPNESSDQPIVNKNKNKEEKQMFPTKNKQVTKENEKINNIQIINSDKEKKSDIKRTSEPCILVLPTTSPQSNEIIKRQKNVSKRSKTSYLQNNNIAVSGNHCNGSYKENAVLPKDSPPASLISSSSSDTKSEEKPQKTVKCSKLVEKGRDQDKKKSNHNHTDINTENISSLLFDNDSTPKTAPSSCFGATKRHGKTPGRERKKESSSTSQLKRSEKKINRLKSNAFQFALPISDSPPNLLSASNNNWNLNQATFSKVVAQKKILANITVPEECSNFSNQNDVEPTALNCIENEKINCNINLPDDWNESDLKNEETFGSMQSFVETKPLEISTQKQGVTDLGAIGTKKSPSTTPIWEMLPTTLSQSNVTRPTPTLTSNSSFFSNSYPLDQVLDYANNTQYFGGNDFVDQLVSQTPTQRTLQMQASRDYYLSLYQQQQNIQQPASSLNFSNQKSNWSATRTWTPMGYEQSPPASSSAGNPWQQQRSNIRPPPGLDFPKHDSPINHQSEISDGHKNLTNDSISDSHVDPIQPFDPFKSLSSIWSENWKNNDKNNN